MHASTIARLLLGLPVICACVQTAQRDELLIGMSFSALPNIGAAVRAAQMFQESSTSTWWIELEATFQFLDDEDIADDGFPKSGDYSQIQLGIIESRQQQGPRRLTLSGGLTWFRVLGAPNIIQIPGDYIGFYYGLGIETHLSEHVTTGPEVSLIVAYGEGTEELVFLPQLNWHLTFGF